MGAKVNEPNPGRLTFFMMGSGGDGVITAGETLARAAAHDGLHCHLTKSFGPQIRGGESAVWLQVGRQRIRSQARAADVLVVLSWKSYPRFATQLRLAPGAVIIQDESERGKEPAGLSDIDGAPLPTPISVPFGAIAQEETNSLLARNAVCVGFLTGLFDIPADTVPSALERRLSKRGAATVEANLRAFERGRQLARREDFAAQARPLGRGDGSPRLFLTGNDAVSLGAIYAGVEFFAGYPITPASEILVNLAAQLPGAGHTVIQAEDELAAMSMVIGASFGGHKAMTATSGPGLSLKTEAIGFAVHAEIPCVIVNVQRGGPSTGMPTKTEQSDLQLAIYGAHGDAPRLVLAAEDVKTCFDTTVKAFYASEKYQCPVIVLTDQAIGHGSETVAADALGSSESFCKVTRRTVPSENPEGPYLRFKLSDLPVSPMSHPGIRGCAYQTSGLIHDEDGRPSFESETHRTMGDRLVRKLDLIQEELGGYRVAGAERARHGIITWGSSVGVALEVAEARTAAGLPTDVLAVEMLSPLPVEAIRAYVAAREKLAVVELTHSGQFARLLRAEGVPLDGAALIHHGGGDSFTVLELAHRLEEAW